jgi:hypothetical protein
MSIPLAEALRDVKLEPGQTYSCQVNGHWVELRVLPSLPATDGSSIPESDIMLDAWVELPEPRGGTLTTSRLGEPDWPDAPVIVPDED